jgi:uncharacterized protein (DUF305 family)
MKTTFAFAAFAMAAAVSLAVPAHAADDTALPDICTSAATGGMDTKMNMPGMSGMDMGGMDTGTDEGHKALMQGMADMNANMDKGMQAEDIDVAFVCGMIPHHQGAIDMAKAELAHGDDPWAKEMAQKVIDAQTKEIADMLAWLQKQSK